MQNLYPLFERNRILKKELLWSLRDYSFAHIRLEYQEHGDGILRGLAVQAREDGLTVGAGIVKYGPYVCLMMEEGHVPYGPSDGMQRLKLRVWIDRSCPDYVAYRSEFLLDGGGALGEDEFELCRFHLRSGARLRDQYTDFYDMATEYDTISPIQASWGGLGGRSLSPAVTRYFARSILSCGHIRPEDRSFAYLSLSQAGAMPAEVLADYIGFKSGEGEGRPLDSQRLYEGLCRILRKARLGTGVREKKDRERRRILVD